MLISAAFIPVQNSLAKYFTHQIVLLSSVLVIIDAGYFWGKILFFSLTPNGLCKALLCIFYFVALGDEILSDLQWHCAAVLSC